MKISVLWLDDCANYPHLIVEDVELDFTYEKRDNCYFAECDGWVRFYAYAEPGRGYGGARFELRMKDGSTETLIGPWSGNSAWAALFGFPDTIDVGGLLHATLPKAIELCKAFNETSDRKIGIARIGRFYWFLEDGTRLKGCDRSIDEEMYVP